MKIWKKTIVLACVVFFSNYVFAKNIVFSCVQNIQAPENSDKISYIIEDSIFSSLFDAGLIVGNIPIRSNEESILENIAVVNKQLENKSEYILLIKIDYAKEPFVDRQTEEKVPHVEKMHYILFDVDKNKILYEKSLRIAKTKTKKDLVRKLEKENKKIMEAVTKKVKS